MKQQNDPALIKTKKHSPKTNVSIKWKVFGFMALFTVIILITLWTVQTLFLSDIYKTIKLNELYKSADDITKSINSDNFEQKVNDIAQKNELCILVLDSKGTSIASSESLNMCVIHHISYKDHNKLYLDAEKNNGEFLERFRFDALKGTYYSVKDDENTTEENIILTKLTTDANGETVIIFINSILTPVAATVKTLNMMLAVISIFLFVLALILSFLFAHGISKPLTRLTRSAEELATGNYDAHFSRSSYKEVDILANTLNHASEELKKNEALKKELIANISHDLRTPLTLITGYSEAMRDFPDEITPENLQIIIDESKRLSSLVNDLLDASKLQSGATKLNCEQFDITSAINETTARYQKLINQDGYDISFVHDSNCIVNADKQKILQVLYNLVNNAVTHTGENKKVVIKQTIITHDSLPYVRIEITDFGDGIEGEQLPHIWDRYYKVDKFHKRAEMGSGLGLSIVKSILELHQGYYGVYSTLGKGSTFWFELPKM